MIFDSNSSGDECDNEFGSNCLTSTDSIAKGVFTFFARKNARGKSKVEASLKKKPRRKKVKESGQEEIQKETSLAHFGLEKKGLDQFRPTRFQSYRNINLTISQIMGEQQKETFSKVLQDVANFARTIVNHQKSLVNQPTAYKENSIPTCVLLTGINLPDHGAMFSLLKKMLIKDISPHVATLNYASCPNLKTLVKQTVAQLIRKDSSDCTAADDPDSDVDNDEDEVKIDTGSRRSIIGSFPRLKTWFENQYHLGCKPVSPKKKAKLEGASEEEEGRPPLVIVIEDFEAFAPKVLQNFILNISMYSDALPFIFVFGVATTVDAVHRALPHSVTSLLTMQTLTAEPSIVILDRFIKAVVTSKEIPLKLGSRIIQILFENFAFCDLSVKNILIAYKWCLLEHFSGRPTSVLCQSDDAKRQELILNDLTEKDLVPFMSLPSFRKLVASKPEQFADLLMDFTKFRQFLFQKISILWQRTETFNIFVGALHALAADLPKDTLGQCFYSVYCSSMCEPVTSSHEYRRTFAFLRHSERADLIKRMTRFVQYLQEHSETNEDARKAAQDGNNFLKELENFDSLHIPAKKLLSSPLKSNSKQQPEVNSPARVLKFESPSRASPRKQAPNSPQKSLFASPTKQLGRSPRKCATPIESPRKSTLMSPSEKDAPKCATAAKESAKPQKFNRFLFQEKMLQEAKERTKQESAVSKNPFVDLRERINTFWHETFDRHLGAGPTSCIPSNQVFHEIQYFDEVGEMREHLIGNAHDAIQTALQDPNVYLQIPALKLDSLSDILPVLPDVSIAYKLYLECQRYINLYDWLQCWLSIVSASDEDGIQENRTNPKLELMKGKKTKGKRGKKTKESEIEENETGLEVDQPVNVTVDARLQARFTRAVSELQFLGFIKPSKRKTDHVERLSLNS